MIISTFYDVLYENAANAAMFQSEALRLCFARGILKKIRGGNQ